MEAGAILEALPGMGAHGSVRQQGAPRVFLVNWHWSWMFPTPQQAK